MGHKPRAAAAVTRRFSTRVFADDKATGLAIEIPFDPAEVFGKVRVPVVVGIGDYRYKSTIARMRGATFVPFRKSHAEATGLGAGDRVEVELAADTEPRVIEPPADLAAALAGDAPATAGWEASSYSHRREHVAAIEGAARPETRARRIARALESLRRTPAARRRTR